MKTKLKSTKQTVGIIGLIVLVVAMITLFTALIVKYGINTVLGWFISSQAILVYIIIVLCASIMIPMIILSKINKR